MKAKKAFEKTLELIKALESGEIVDVDPMKYIKKYAKKYHEKNCVDVEEFEEDNDIKRVECDSQETCIWQKTCCIDKKTNCEHKIK